MAGGAIGSQLILTRVSAGCGLCQGEGTGHVLVAVEHRKKEMGMNKEMQIIGTKKR